MENADEMFEKLGYKKAESNLLNYIEYSKPDGKRYILTISFSGNAGNTIMCAIYDNENKLKRAMPLAITSKEVEAINKKVEELGWNK